MGSEHPNFRHKGLIKNYNFRLGLSATPKVGLMKNWY